jgi:hypothetical protein
MDITMPKHILMALLQDAAELGASAVLAKSGILKPYISKSDAYRMYGESAVDRWIAEGLVTPRKDGGHSAKWRIDRQEIEAVAKASNRPSYTAVKERKISTH